MQGLGSCRSICGYIGAYIGGHVGFRVLRRNLVFMGFRVSGL